MSRAQSDRKSGPDPDPILPDVIDDAGLHFPADDAGKPYVKARLEGRSPARDVLPVIALLDALGPAGVRRLQAPKPLALVIQVPGADWCAHVEGALRDIADFAHVVVRDGVSRHANRQTEGNDLVARRLAEGARVAGICHAPERYLPETLLAAADMVVRIGPPSNKVLSLVIRAATGKRTRRMPPSLAGSLTFDALTAQIRFGSTAKECVARLQAAAGALSGGDANLGDVPDLESAHGYGPAAMTWARALVRDVEAWRAGRLEWSAVQRTALFYGPPGTGKTTFVRIAAKAAGLPLIATSVSSWFSGSSGYLDGVLKAWEAKIAEASAKAPCLLFIDEVDALPSRERLSDRGRDFWNSVIAGVLATLDSTTSGEASRLVVVGATNHVAALDPALIRPGRLFPTIEIPPPSAADLAGILRHHLGVDIPDADLLPVAHLGAGGTGADAVGWVKAARSMARAEGRRVTLPDLVQAVAPDDERTPEELLVCARHESAHAVAALLLDVGALNSVSLAMAKTSAGVTRTWLHKRNYLTRPQIEDLAVVALVGRAMDAAGGAPNSGAGGGEGSDLAKATELVAAMHASYGLGDDLTIRGGPAFAVTAMREDPLLRHAVERDVRALYVRAVTFVREHRPVIEAVADRLVAERILTGADVERLVRIHSPLRNPIPARRTRDAR